MYANIYLEAVCPDKGIQRFFTIEADQDLFKGWYIRAANGRIGTKSSVRTYRFEDETSLDKKLRQLLRKRINAKTRLGCNYQVKRSSISPNVLIDLVASKKINSKNKHKKLDDPYVDFFTQRLIEQSQELSPRQQKLLETVTIINTKMKCRAVFFGSERWTQFVRQKSGVVKDKFKFILCRLFLRNLSQTFIVHLL